MAESRALKGMEGILKHSKRLAILPHVLSLNKARKINHAVTTPNDTAAQ